MLGRFPDMDKLFKLIQDAHEGGSSVSEKKKWGEWVGGVSGAAGLNCRVILLLGGSLALKVGGAVGGRLCQRLCKL